MRFQRGSGELGIEDAVDEALFELGEQATPACSPSWESGLEKARLDRSHLASGGC